VLFLLSVVSGCSAARRDSASPAQTSWTPPPKVPGPIGILVDTSPPAASIPAFFPGGRVVAAAAGAGAGLGVGVLGALACPATLSGLAPAVVGCFLAIYTPVLVVNGAVEGAVKTPSAATATKWRTLMEAAASDATVQATLRGQLIENAREMLPDRAFIPLDDTATSPGQPAAPEASAGHGPIVTVLEVAVLSIALAPQEPGTGPVTDDPGAPSNDPTGMAWWGAGLSFEGLFDRRLGLVVTARARVVRAPDGEELLSRTFTERSAPRRRSEWAADNARTLRDQRDRLMARLAREILTMLLEPEPTAQPGEPL
jgi:hypothetical protein